SDRLGFFGRSGHLWLLLAARAARLLAYHESEINLAYRRYGDGKRVDRLAQEISRIVSEANRNGHPLTKDDLIRLYLGVTMEEVCRGISEVWREDPARAADWLVLADGAARKRGTASASSNAGTPSTGRSPRRYSIVFT